MADDGRGLSAHAIRRAFFRAPQSCGDRLEFVQHDVREPWPVPDDAFDVVVATLVLEHIEKLEPFFVQLERVLRPGGTAFLSELHPERQRRGSQGRFVGADGNTVSVPATLHNEVDYLNAGNAAGLQLVRQRDRYSPADIAKQSPPRLITFTWQKFA